MSKLSSILKFGFGCSPSFLNFSASKLKRFHRTTPDSEMFKIILGGGGLSSYKTAVLAAFIISLLLGRLLLGRVLGLSSSFLGGGQGWDREGPLPKHL